MQLHFGKLVLSAARNITGTTLLAFALSLFSSLSMAQDEVKLSEAQARNIGVRVTHPVSSRTDQTLPYPAQIVIPTPQLWVVSAPIAGMVINLSVGRGDRISPASLSSRWKARDSFLSSATICMRSHRKSSPRSNSNGTWTCSKARPYRNACWRQARPRHGRPASLSPSGDRCCG